MKYTTYLTFLLYTFCTYGSNHNAIASSLLTSENYPRETTMKCYVCEPSSTDPFCSMRGKRLQCDEDEVCYQEIRSENQLHLRRFGCKQWKACKEMEFKNQKQCSRRPACTQPGCAPRLCQKCCWNKDYCNLNPSLVRLPKPIAPSSKPRQVISTTTPKVPTRKTAKLEPGLIIVLPDGVEVEDIIQRRA